MNYTLNLLEQIAHGIAVQFGTNCEVVIHDLKKTDIPSSIVYIENGHVTNRIAGDGPSRIVLETLQKHPDHSFDKLAYLTKTDDGRILKSSTLFIHDENNTLRFIFSLNYDITDLLAVENVIKPLIETPEKKEFVPNKITHNVNDLLDELIEQSVAIVGKPVSLMTKNDKIQAIRFLNDAGAFLITKSGDKVSSYFGISKFTLYSYMDSGK